jgi:hypothetical protein
MNGGRVGRADAWGSDVLYLAYTDDHDLRDDIGDHPDGPWRDLRRLRAGLVLVDSDQRRSVVYHAIKDLLPPETALLVAELAEVPKFKGMDPGALAWARAHAPGT